MKLAICTDVFADLSYTDMLDKVKSLGIDAVEMTAGGRRAGGAAVGAASGAAARRVHHAARTAAHQFYRGQYRTILSADTAGEVRQLLSQKRR